jgi:DNA-binding transcriptional ArsR family regulator
MTNHDGHEHPEPCAAPKPPLTGGSADGTPRGSEPTRAEVLDALYRCVARLKELHDEEHPDAPFDEAGREAEYALSILEDAGYIEPRCVERSHTRGLTPCGRRASYLVGEPGLGVYYACGTHARFWVEGCRKPVKRRHAVRKWPASPREVAS